MSPREQRILLVILLGIAVVLGGGVGGLKFFWQPIRERDGSITVLQQEIDKKRLEVAKLQAERVKLDRWRQMSLPADVDLASREYEKFLSDLLRQSKFAPGAFTIESKKGAKSPATLPGKKEPIYTKLGFTVTTRGDLASLVAFLERFYRTGLLHQIKDVSIQRPRTASQGQRPGDLDITLGVEALVLKEAENRPYLAPIDQRIVALDALTAMRRGPTGLALAAVQAGPAGPLGPRALAEGRDYRSILGKNIFFGPPPERPKLVLPPKEEKVVDKTDVREFVHLTDITQGPTKVEAFLWDRYNSRRTRLQVAAGFDTFRIRNSAGDTLVSGKVVKIADRDVIFITNDKYYALHVGESIKEAMAQPLKDDRIKEFNLKPLKGSTPSEPPPEELKQFPKEEPPAKPEPGPEKEADKSD
jgi:hypothetical protein